MQNIYPYFQLLSRSNMEQIHEKSLSLLEKTGITCHHHKALELLAEAGAKVDFANSHVLIPKILVEKALESAPKSFALGATNSKHHVVLPHPETGFYTRSATGAQGCIDLENDTLRSVMIADVKNWVIVNDVLDNVNICAVPTPQDVPPKTSDIHALRCALEHTQKHIMVQPYSQESLKYLAEMAVIAAGGNSQFITNPIISMVSCATSPLCYKSMDIEIMFSAQRHGFPIHIASLASPGGTSPITISGSVLQVNVEILGGLVLSQMIQPGTPVIAVSQHLPLHMVTGTALQATIEAAMADVAGIQVIKELYRLPTRTYSLCSDAVFGDSGAMVERTLLGTLAALAKTDILSAIGGIEAQNAISLRQLAIDNDILGMLKRLMQGIKIDEDELAATVIAEIGTTGNYLAHDHTLRHCRDIYDPKLFYRNGRSADHPSGTGDILDRAKEKIIRILKEERGPYLSDALISEMDEVVRKADEQLSE